ncbi:hypothetical protein EVAR_6315_1 [Eumeta japonica]|uniref:Uncharacterized protein n=1 Tax=Eumeta variegata TaxID=151549 RepID=A0A4C1T8L9_EUMVA|nr:hypothetical protein EVAR_6315_1 [Eumeta japonica]
MVDPALEVCPSGRSSVRLVRPRLKSLNSGKGWNFIMKNQLNVQQLLCHDLETRSPRIPRMGHFEGCVSHASALIEAGGYCGARSNGKLECLYRKQIVPRISLGNCVL